MPTSCTQELYHNHLTYVIKPYSASYVSLVPLHDASSYLLFILLSLKLLFLINVQVNVFLSRINGERIGFSVLGIFVIDKNTILTVSSLFL